MGRREKPLDPAAGPVQRFAYELRELRREAGSPTYRAMAERSGYSAPTLSGAAAGERLPSLPVALAYAGVCGGDPDEWEKRWHEAAAAEPATVRDDEESAPYRGLARYGPEDRGHFFGRDQLVADLVGLTRRSRIAAVVGASGSGKSSLLRAGLVAALRDDPKAGPRPEVIRILTPGPHPARTHAALFTAGALVVVDQFEELFTLCRDPAERKAFLELLLDSDARAVIAVRADFYGRCAEHPGLADALRDAALLIGPMTPEQLRTAVVGPATSERLIVERALTARIVADVADEPGGLPLMSHALLETWRRRRGRTLTEHAYDAIGGVQGAIAHTAEGVFGRFTESEALTARELLLRLISPGDGTLDTRRPADRDELVSSAGSEQVLERLVRARLLTVDGSAVNLAHEALITGWPRLRAWIDQDRDRLRLHRRLTEAAARWEELGRDAGALYRGGQLASAQAEFAGPAGVRGRGAAATASERDASADSEQDLLTRSERDFLTASRAAHDREVHTAARTTRRLRVLTGTLSVLLCLAAVAGLTAWQQSRTSARRATEAEARRVAGVAEGMRHSDPRTAMRLSVAAWRIADLPETREALFGAAAQRDLDTFTPALPEFAPEDNSVWERLSGDGRTLTVIGPDRTDRWDVPTRRKLPAYPGLGAHAARIMAVSPDTRSVAVRTSRGVRLWDVAAGKPTGPAFGPAGDDVSGWFTPGGRVFAVHGHGGSLQLWDTRRGRLLLDTDRPRQEIRTLDISADDRLLAFCAGDEPLEVWDVRERRRVPTPWATAAKVCEVQQVQFTPDGRSLAVGTETAVRILDVRSGRERGRIPTSGPSETVFSQDGSHVATLAEEEIRLWRTADPTSPVLRLPANGVSLHDLRLDMGAGEGGALRYLDSIAGVSGARTIRTVALDEASLGTPRQQPYEGAKFGPDGDTLATTVGNRVELRDGDSGHLRAALPGPGCDHHCRTTMAFARDGRTFAHLNASGAVTVRTLGPTPTASVLPSRPRVDGLALGGGDGRTVAVSTLTIDTADLDRAGRGWSTVRRDRNGVLLATAPDGRLLTEYLRLIDPRTGRATRVMRGEERAEAVAFSSDGRYLAMSDHDGRTTLWNAAGKHRLAVLAPAVPDAPQRDDWHVPALAFSADGRTVAVGDADGALRLWDTSSPRSQGSPLPPADGPVLALAFGSGGSGGSELRVTTPHTAIRTYPLAADRTAEAVCDRAAGAGLSRVDWDTYLPNVPYRSTC